MTHLTNRLEEGSFDRTLIQLYGADGLARARSRCRAVLDAFVRSFDGEAQYLFSAPGRTELGATIPTINMDLTTFKQKSPRSVSDWGLCCLI